MGLILDFNKNIIKDCLSNPKKTYLIINNNEKCCVRNLRKFIDLIIENFPEEYEKIKISRNVILLSNGSYLIFANENWLKNNTFKNVIYK